MRRLLVGGEGRPSGVWVRGPLLAALLLGAACGEGGDSAVEEGGGGGVEPDGYESLYTDCYSMDRIRTVRSAIDPMHPPVCGFLHDPGPVMFDTDVHLRVVALRGEEGEAVPASGRIAVVFDPLAGTDVYPSDALVSLPLTVSGDASYWVTVAAGDQLGTLDTCTEDCSFTPIVEIDDPARAAAGACADYANLQWCPDFVLTGALR